MPPPRPAPCSRPSPMPSPGARRSPSPASGSSPPRTARHALAATRRPAKPSPSPPRECRPSRPGRPFATRSTHSKGAGPPESPAPAAPMSSRTHCRARGSKHDFATHVHRCAGSEVPVLPHRLLPGDRLTGPHYHRRIAIPMTPRAFAPRSVRGHQGSGTFGAATIRRVIAGSHCLSRWPWQRREFSRWAGADFSALG